MSHYNDPQDSTPYEDEDLIDIAKIQLHEEFEEASSPRVARFLSSVEISEVVYLWYCKQHQIGHYLDQFKDAFVNHYLHSEIDLLVEESKQSAAEAYADYLSDR